MNAGILLTRWLETFTRWAQQHRRDFFLWLIILRLLLLPLRVWTLFWLPYHSEYRFWWEMMELFGRQGYFPYVHYWSEYPPVMPWLVTGIYQFSQWGLDGLAARACFYLLYGLLLIAAEVGVLVILYHLAKRLSQPAAEQGVTLFAVGFLPVYLWSGWWDYLPLFLLLAAWVLLISGRDKFSAALIGIGMLTKMFPVLLLPLAVCMRPTWRRKIIYASVVMITAILIVLPLGVANPPMTAASFQNIATRPSWETIWALFDGYYSYGTVAPLEQRLNPASSQAASHGSQIPWKMVTLLFGFLFAALYLFLWIKSHRQAGEPRILTVALTLSIGLLLLYSKGYSPQYLIWITPFLVVLYPTRQMALVLAMLLGANLIELPIYINFFPDQVWLLFVTVSIRTILLGWLAVKLAKELIMGWHAPRAFVPATPA